MTCILISSKLLLNKGDFENGKRFIIEMVCFFCVKLCKNMAYSKQKDSCFHEPFSLEKRV